MARSLHEVGLDDCFVQAGNGLGITQLTPTQVHTIRAVGRGADYVMEAPPDQGIDIALALGIHQKVKNDPGAQALLIVPTGEDAWHYRILLLFVATHLETVNFTCFMAVQDGPIMIEGTPTVVVGEPASLKRLRRSGGMHLNTDRFGTVAFVEADRLLDERYEEEHNVDIQSLLESLPPPCGGRQTLLFSTQPLPPSAVHFYTTALPVQVPGSGNPRPHSQTGQAIDVNYALRLAQRPRSVTAVVEGSCANTLHHVHVNNSFHIAPRSCLGLSSGGRRRLSSSKESVVLRSVTAAFGVHLSQADMAYDSTGARICERVLGTAKVEHALMQPSREQAAIFLASELAHVVASQKYGAGHRGHHHQHSEILAQTLPQILKSIRAPLSTGLQTWQMTSWELRAISPGRLQHVCVQGSAPSTGVRWADL